MTQREEEKKRLYELIAQSYTANRSKWEVELFEDYMLQEEIPKLVDDLVDGGVIVPPCKVGDFVWLVEFSDKEIINGYVEEISYKWVYQQETVLVSMRMNTKRGWLTYWRDFYAFGDHVFLSKAEAEQALKERET